MANGDCPVGAENRANIETMKESIHELWEAVNGLRNNVPPWASLMMTGLGIAAGAAITAIITLLTG